MKTKVDIISGFLGAGKTTLIKKLLEEKLSGEKLVIIENEFGEIGIDGSILQKSGIEVKEINSGCICCSLVGDFGEAIEEVIAKYEPDRIIIEPSGVGKLSDVVKACGGPRLKELLAINMLITVVDVIKYQLYLANFGEFFENQIKNAKTVVLSRTQKVDRKRLESAVSSIRRLNGKANVITTPWESLDAGLMISVAEQDAALSLEQQMKDAKKVVLKRHAHHHSAEEVFDVWSMETPRVYSKKELKDMLEMLENEKSCGMVLRSKGILQLDDGGWVQFDYVPGEYEMKSMAADYTGRLCVIGKDLNKSGLGKLFQITA